MLPRYIFPGRKLLETAVGKEGEWQGGEAAASIWGKAAAPCRLHMLPLNSSFALLWACARSPPAGKYLQNPTQEIEKLLE